MAAHFGSALSFTLSGAGAAPSNLILPAMDAVPAAAAAAGAAASDFGGADSDLGASPPPQAARERPAKVMRAKGVRETFMNSGSLSVRRDVVPVSRLSARSLSAGGRGGI